MNATHCRFTDTLLDFVEKLELLGGLVQLVLRKLTTDDTYNMDEKRGGRTSQTIRLEVSV